MNRGISQTVFLILGCALLTMFEGCMKNSDHTAMTGAQYFWLPSYEVAQLSNLAEKGDKDAAFRLYEYYAFGVFQEKDAIVWLKIAVDLGHEKAKLYLKAYEDARKEDYHQVPTNNSVTLPSPPDGSAPAGPSLPSPAKGVKSRKGS